jgi:hypothetical protein
MDDELEYLQREVKKLHGRVLSLAFVFASVAFT